LKTAGVGKDGPGPGHEAVKPAEAFNALVPGPKKQVVRIGQDDLGIEIILEISGR
jgi:hypothetical protein